MVGMTLDLPMAIKRYTITEDEPQERLSMWTVFEAVGLKLSVFGWAKLFQMDTRALLVSLESGKGMMAVLRSKRRADIDKLVGVK